MRILHHCEPLRLRTGSRCDEQLPNALPQPLSSPWPKHTCTSRPSFWLLPSQPPPSPTRQDVDSVLSKRTFCAISPPQTTHDLLGTTAFRQLRWIPWKSDRAYTSPSNALPAPPVRSGSLLQAGPSASHSQTPGLVPQQPPHFQRNSQSLTCGTRRKLQSCLLLPGPRPPPSLLTPAALAPHGMPNAASHLPSVSRDARYAYRTRISRKPSSPCPHRPQNA